MGKRFQYISFSSIVLITLMVSLLLPTAALADGSTPPPTNPPPVVVTPNAGATGMPTNAVATQPAPTNAVATQPAPTNAIATESTPTSVVPTLVATDAIATQPAPTNVAPANAAPAVAVATQPAPTVATIGVIATETPIAPTVAATETPVGAKKPADLTGVVVAMAAAGAVMTDANGNLIPLASKQAADMLQNPDPYVVRAGVTNRFLSSCAGQPVDATNTCTVSTTPVQAAITFAAAGETVHVGAGTYTEQIVISKSLTLVGAGAGTTIIQAPAVLTNDPDGAKTIVLFSGPITAEFSGFTVQGPVKGLNFGIYVRAGANANIHDNVIKDIRDAPFSGNQTGVAIEVGKYPDTAPVVSQTGTATITNNQIYGYQKTGIAVEYTGSSATITGNTITGAGPTNITAQNGIQIRRGATATIKTNTVTGNAWDGPTWSAEGIGALRAGSGVVIQGNIVNHNSSNIYSWNSDGIQILDNQVSDSATVDQNNSAGITVQADGLPDPYGGATGPYLTGVTISGNTIRNNLSGASTQSDGIDLYGINGATVSNNVITGSSYDGILIGGSGNITITGNQFSGNGLLVSDSNAAAIDFRGIPSRDWSLPLGNGGANPLGGFVVHNNSFVGNRIAIWNYDSGSVNATNNWWGCTTGPGTAGCDTVSSNVTFNPFLTTDPFAAPPAGGGGGGGALLPLNIVAVTGGELVTLNTTISTTLRLPSGNQVSIDPGAGTTASVTPNTEASLPGALPGGDTFASAMTVSVMNGGAAVGTLPAGKTMEVSFVAPPLPAGQTFSILYWNPALNGGLGGWVEVPATVTSDGHVVASVNFTGTFVLVTK